MKKGTIIERIQTVLNGGRTSEDVELKYPYELIESLVDSTIIEIITAKDTNDLTDSISGKIAVPYVVPVTDFKKVELPVAPANKTNSILSIKGVNSGAEYGIRVDVAQIVMMGALRPYSDAGAYASQINDTWCLVFDKALRTGDDSLTVFMVPSFSDLSDDDEIFLDGNENLIDDLIIPRLRFADIPSDTVDNQVYDTDGPKIQGGK